MAEGSIFRKVALERLSTPDQLDQAMRVTAPAGWAALGGLFALAAGALVWGVLGTAPVKVKGQGILLASGGVLDVVSTSQGRLHAYSVRRGDVIHEGQVIAVVEQPALTQMTGTARSELAELLRRKEHISAFHARDDEVQRALRDRKRADLTLTIRNQEERLRWLQERSAGEERLLSQGIISRQKYLDGKVEIAKLRETLAQARSAIQALGAEEAAARQAKQREILDLDLEIAAAQRRLGDMEERVARESRVISPYSGMLVEFKLSAGEVVTPGVPLFSLLPQDAAGDLAKAAKDLVGIIYVPPEHGKKIEPGMRVQVAPASFKREEYGTIHGKVLSVATIPSTPEGMAQTLKNRQLVQTLSNGGAPFEIKVALEQDESSPSGFRWSSRGPDQAVNTGTLAEAEVTVKRMRLITLVVPALEEIMPAEDRS